MYCKYIIDVNLVPNIKSVNSGKNPKYPIFRKLLKNKKWKIVVGGSRLIEECNKIGHFRTLIKDLKDMKKAEITTEEQNEEIDKLSEEINSYCKNHGCDDAHIVALTLFSRARLVITQDTGLKNVLKDAALFNLKGVRRPRVYRKTDGGYYTRININQICPH